MPTITPCLWFDTEAEEAARFYTTVFPHSSVTQISHDGEAGPRPAGTVMMVGFELDGKPFSALNGGPQFTFDEAISFVIECEDQTEVDHYWDALSEGGEEVQCGWLKDRFGISWQIVPTAVSETVGGPDPEGAARATRAMLGMKKFDVAALRAAYAGTA